MWYQKPYLRGLENHIADMMAVVAIVWITTRSSNGSCIVEHRLDGHSISQANAREERWWSGRAADEKLCHAIAGVTGVVGAFEYSADAYNECGDVIMGVLPAGVVREGEFGDRLPDMIAGGGTSCKASLSHGWLLRIGKLQMKEHQEELMVNCLTILWVTFVCFHLCVKIEWSWLTRYT